MLLIQRQGFEDYAISERSNGTVTFEVIVPLAFGEGVRIGEQVQYKDYRLRVDEIERTRNNYRLVGSLDLQLLKSSIISLNEYQRYTLADLAALIGVTFIGEFNAGETYSRSSLKFNKGTKYDLLKAVFALKHLGAAYRGGLTFYLCDFRLKARKAKHLAHRDLNVINVANRLEGFNQFNTVTVEGKDGITATVTSAAAGEAAVIKYVSDQRFTDPQALRAYAEALLADYSVPYNEYTIKMVETKEQPLQLLDTVKHVGIDGDGEIHRIVELERTNERIEVSLINKRQNLADVFADYQEQQEIKNQFFSATQNAIKDSHANFARETANNFSTVNQRIDTTNNNLAQAKEEINTQIQNANHTFSESISRTVEKFESRYKEVDKRLSDTVTEFESQITQTARKIEAKVSELRTEHGQLIQANKSSITQTAQEINASVSRLTTSVSNRITNLAAEFKIRADGISLTVTRNREEWLGAHNNLVGRVNTQESRITQTANKITSEVTRVENAYKKADTELKNSVTSKITQTANSITQEVKEVKATADGAATYISAIKVKADSIRLTVQTKVPDLQERMRNAELSLEPGRLKASVGFSHMTCTSHEISLNADKVVFRGRSGVVVDYGSFTAPTVYAKNGLYVAGRAVKA